MGQQEKEVPSGDGRRGRARGEADAEDKRVWARRERPSGGEEEPLPEVDQDIQEPHPATRRAGAREAAPRALQGGGGSGEDRALRRRRRGRRRRGRGGARAEAGGPLPRGGRREVSHPQTEAHTEQAERGRDGG